MRCTETRDSVLPSLQSCTINYGTGVMTITADETLDATPSGPNTHLWNFSTYLDPSKIQISNVAGASVGVGTGVNLAGAAVTNVDGLTVTITLTELQRVQSIAMSNTPGGDSGAVVVDFSVGAVRDVGTNQNAIAMGISMTETADTILPIVLAGAIDYGTGILQINASETIDVTASSLVDLQYLFLAQATTDSYVPLVGATVLGTDALIVTLQLTETQRATAVVGSATLGGDGSALLLDAFAGAVIDIGENRNTDQTNLALVEIADDVHPSVVLAASSIALSTGILTIEASESVDHSSVIVSGITIRDVVSGGAVISLVGAVPIIPSGRSPIFEIQLTELQRVSVIEISNTKGGDGSNSILNIAANTFADLSSNAIESNADNVGLAEVADDTLPVLESATLDLENGILRLVPSEIVDVEPGTNVVPSKFQINDQTGVTVVQLSLPFATIFGQTNQQSFQLKLTESQRAAAIAISGQPGGDLVATRLDIEAGAYKDIATNLNVQQLNLLITESPDITHPSIVSAAIFLNNPTARVEITANETIDVYPASNVVLSKVQLKDDDFTLGLTSATVVTTNGVTVTIELTETQRVQAIYHSNTPGGDSSTLLFKTLSGALQDIATRSSVESVDITMTETADTVDPTLTAAQIDYGSGIITFDADETLDFTPVGGQGYDNFNMTLIYISNSIGEYTINMDTAQVTTNADTTQFFVKLDEADRVAALRISSTPGGDEGAGVTREEAFVEVKPGAVMDVAQNHLSVEQALKFSEVPDIIKPTGMSAALDYGTGLLQITCSETIESLNLAKIKLVNIHGDTDYVIDDGLIIEQDTVTVTIKLSESDRLNVLRVSGTPGGDNVSVTLELDAGALTDPAENQNLDQTNIAVVETADTIPPIAESASLDFNNGRLIITCSETVDVTPASLVDLSLMYIADLTGDQAVPLTGATVVNSADDPVLTLTLTEAQRAAAIAISGVPGGDGDSVVLDVTAGSLTDITGTIYFGRELFASSDGVCEFNFLTFAQCMCVCV